jgi:RsiW-degrading membrane proteinase PrsW (M82 family)
MLCSWKSRARKRYQLTVLMEMLAYILMVLGETPHVRKYHHAGFELYFLSLMPCVPIVGVLFAVGLYLRDEKDEYQRDLMVKSLLWGTAGVLAITTFFGFLRSFEWKGTEPPFLEFIAFWISVALAKLFYTVTSRVSADE